MDQVGKVERMKQCILEGMHPNFAHPVIPQMAPQRFHNQAPPEFYYNFHPAGAPIPPQMTTPQFPMGRGRGGPMGGKACKFSL